MSTPTTTAPQLIVGLGNPGSDYADHRHNVGFWWLDRYAGSNSFRPESRFFGEVAKAPNGTVWFIKPSTYMNRSGMAVAALARFYRIPTEAILVVHDELDLLPGQARLKFGGSSGGHNGLKDLQSHCGGPNFWRLRIGIGHPRKINPNKEVASYVLERPGRSDQAAIDDAILRSMDVMPQVLAGNYLTAMQSLHRDPSGVA